MTERFGWLLIDLWYSENTVSNRALEAIISCRWSLIESEKFTVLIVTANYYITLPS